MNELATRYLIAKKVIIDQGFQREIIWQSSLCFEDLNETDFLREHAWVILSSGMRERIIRKLFPNISHCFFDWLSSKAIADNSDICFRNAINQFNHRPKIAAIIYAAKKLNDANFNDFKIQIKKNPLEILRQFPYIGPITVFHLAKNIGLPVAKPDRHLVRIANQEGFHDIQDFCRQISKESGDSVPVVDIVLWRFATVEKDYLAKFREL